MYQMVLSVIVRRRDLMKSLPGIVTGAAVGPSVVSAAKSPRSLRELHADFQRYTEKHGNPVNFEKHIRGSDPEDEHHLSTKGKRARAMSVSGSNTSYDIFEFEDGAERTLKYTKNDDGTIVAKWNGDKYQTSSGEELEEKLLNEGKAHLQSLDGGPSANTRENNRRNKRSKYAATTQSHNKLEEISYFRNGFADDSGLLGGTAKTRSSRDIDECQGLVEGAGLSRGWAKAEGYQEVSLSGIDWNSEVKIEADGFIRGVITNGLSAGHARGKVFVRETDSDEDLVSEDIFEVNLGIANAWSKDDRYDLSFVTDKIDNGTYEIGIRLSLTAKCVIESASIVDFYTNPGLDHQTAGELNHDSIVLYET